MSIFAKIRVPVALVAVFGFVSTAQAENMREIAEKMMGRLGAVASTQEAACSTCHALNPQLIGDWGAKAEETRRVCFKNKSIEDTIQLDQSTVRNAIECMRDAAGQFHPHKLGLLAAGAHLNAFKDLFVKGYNSETEYSEFLSRVKMPPNGQARFNETEFSQLLLWSRNRPSFPFMLEIFQNVEFPTQCQNYVSPKLKQHIESLQTHNWKTRNANQGMMMFACSSDDANMCFTQKRSDQSDVFPKSKDTIDGATWGADFQEGALRIVHKIPYRTQFWMRTSADGRFIGNGVTNVALPDYEGLITDLSGLLNTSQNVKDIPVLGSYDPSFFVDNSGFLFQGNETGICSQRVLEDPNVQQIDWQNPGCSASPNHEVDAYQSVGTKLDAGDLVALTGNHQTDIGSRPFQIRPFNSGSQAHFQVLIHDGTQYQNTSSVIKQLPFEGDFAISPSTTLMASRITGADDEYQSLALGYKFYKIDSNIAEEKNPLKIEEIANFCYAGLKGNFSFDERFWTYYRFVSKDDWKEFGFSSPDDVNFLALVNKSSNVYVLDLLTGTHRRVTRMNPGEFAQFPHFRSDNWIMFMVGGINRYVVASDAALHLAKK